MLVDVVCFSQYLVRSHLRLGERVNVVGVGLFLRTGFKHARLIGTLDSSSSCGTLARLQLTIAFLAGKAGPGW